MHSMAGNLLCLTTPKSYPTVLEHTPPVQHMDGSPGPGLGFRRPVGNAGQVVEVVEVG